ncbi:MAG TPA: MarR family transcriptional regulator [Thermoanaerobaculia bacterium]|nr:MarR family transcriptional regulator [Thermoanaerobaculia bacterium]
MTKKNPKRTPSREAEAYLGLVRTADVMLRQVDRVLKPYGLTSTQYNVLRILRGAGEGVTCSTIGERLVTEDPDVTRLLDRMEKAELIERSRSAADRRVVLTSLTKRGEELLAKLDPEIEGLHATQFDGVPKKSIDALIAQLETLRSKS